MLNPFKEEIDTLVKNAENAKIHPPEFVKTIEYFHSVFAYILGIIEMRKSDKN